MMSQTEMTAHPSDGDATNLPATSNAPTMRKPANMATRNVKILQAQGDLIIIT